jgi:death-on-curing protein
VKDITFLTLAEVIEIHADQIARYGGSSGIKDINLLSSAVAMPYAFLQDRFLHSNLFEMAAAYAYHISQNHPFIDGNKRTGLATALVFLELNGISVSDPEGKLYDAIISLASGKLDKAGLAALLVQLQE